MKDTEILTEIQSLLGSLLKVARAILDEMIGSPQDDMVDTQRDDPKPKKKAKQQTEDIRDELEDMFGHEIFEYLQLDGGTVQIIKYIKKAEKWKVINSFLREYGYVYVPVEKGLGSWRL